jgi:hypothetical protein
MAGTPPRFSMGKSYPGFGPVGPWPVTPDEFANPGDLELGRLINGERMQKGRTSQLTFGVPELIEQSWSRAVFRWPLIAGCPSPRRRTVPPPRTTAAAAAFPQASDSLRAPPLGRQITSFKRNGTRTQPPFCASARA